MKVKHNLLAALAITGLAALNCPATASAANTTANAKLLNVVQVDYKDASGNNSFTAAASTTVTVLLKESALNYALAPNGSVGGPACPPAVSTVSGGTVSALIALTATANGADTYTQSLFTNTPSNATNQTVSYSTLDYLGLNPVAGPLNREFGSAIPTAVKDAFTLYFPGGALAGFQENDIVVVAYGAGNKVFLVDTVSVGSAATHPNSAAGPFTTGDRTQIVPEVPGELKLKAYDTQSITLNGVAVNFGGGNTAPDFVVTPPTLQVPLGELVLVQVDVTASANSITNDGTVEYSLTVTDGTNPTAITCTAGPFVRTSLSIMKQARNLTDNGAFGNTATGEPGEILEYKVTVSNTGGQASKVVVADAVPTYTTLVTGNAYGSATPGNIFAKVSDNAGTPNSVELTTADDTEVQPLGGFETGFGKATGTSAGSPLTFYVGDTATNALGGTVPSCSDATVKTQAACSTGTWMDTYTILYQVRID